MSPWFFIYQNVSRKNNKGVNSVLDEPEANISQSHLDTPPVGCYMPNIRPSPYVLLPNHKVDTHSSSLGGWKAEST